MTDGTNPNPKVFQRREIEHVINSSDSDDEIETEVDNIEIFDLIRDIEDPEHPLTLEQLNVVSPEQISVDLSKKEIVVKFTPTVPNCSSASLIGLIILCKLKRTVHSSFYIRVILSPGSHDQEQEINKQLNDKERVAAAFENKTLMKTINAKLISKYD